MPVTPFHYYYILLIRREIVEEAPSFVQEDDNVIFYVYTTYPKYISRDFKKVLMMLAFKMNANQSITAI